MKEARALAGLSLGQVARQDISRTAIYFVETGKAKPSRETLQLIAERTGQPLDFFLAGAEGARDQAEARVAELERLIAMGDNQAVVTAAEAALSLRYDAATEAQIRRIASLAHLRLAQPVVGRRMAAAARAYFEQAGDLEMVAECLGNEASGAILMQDPGAVQIAEGALETLRSLKPVPRPLEARLLTTLGHTLISGRRWRDAIVSYEAAVAAADVVQDLHRLSLVYSGLSLAHQEMGQIKDATRYAQKALTIHETLHDQISLARSLNNLGYMLTRLGELAAARTYIDRAMRIFEELNVETGRATTMCSLAELEFSEGRLETAMATALSAAELASRLGESASVAEAEKLRGMILARQGRAVEADDAFAAALAAGELAGGGRRVVEVHAAYADVLEARGDLRAANRHLRNALAAQNPGIAVSESSIAIA